MNREGRKVMIGVSGLHRRFNEKTGLTIAEGISQRTEFGELGNWGIGVFGIMKYSLKCCVGEIVNRSWNMRREN